MLIKKLKKDGSILVPDLLSVMIEWAILNREKKSSSPDRYYRPSQVSEQTLKRGIQDIFTRHDENNNGRIDFGSEFDSFLFDLSKILWPDGSMAHASRD
jgi:hypothetical protein